MSILDYLRSSVAEHKPWDQVFREVVLGPWDTKERQRAKRFLLKRLDSLDDLTNDTAKRLCLALPPRLAADLALRIAGEADAKVAALSHETLAAIRQAGRVAPPQLQDVNGAPFNLARAVHSREHLDAIERALGLA